ncbi:hypothetical protein IE53DRAFT_225251 [Violaceomyces palustris]|uniref:Uncharacterized protein n=1 Tax=Violaceomyces palustris TaxID=1673888 RepID=A0ACD0NPZ8_9BASI|nr:hypothetical protein IE53DRAFT_225251 [Violaceomyces palustris]
MKVGRRFPNPYHFVFLHLFFPLLISLGISVSFPSLLHTHAIYGLSSLLFPSKAPLTVGCDHSYTFSSSLPLSICLSLFPFPITLSILSCLISNSLYLEPCIWSHQTMGVSVQST